MPATFNDLIVLMDRLRSPGGCPWDREQTYATLAPMLLEEAYEAFDAVEEARAGRPLDLRDELGDLLFQIVFYAQVARERGEFTIADVTDAIHTKMVRRHPHVFGDVTANDSATVLLNWEVMKAEERRAAGRSEESNASLLDGVSSKAPSLMEAHQLSTKAARVGFDWENEAGVREEIGDLLFAVTNIARHMQVEPEAALKLTNRKFRRRFRYIEEKLRERKQTFETTTLDEMESLWQEAKEIDD